MLWNGLGAVGVVVILVLSGFANAGGAEDEEPLGTPIAAAGAFTCDFTVSTDPTFLPEVGPVIDRDRMYMTARPGMQFKHIPILPDPEGEKIHSGGRYLFDTAHEARIYFQWVRDHFALDDVLFFDRSEIFDPECFAWHVIGAHEFEPVEEQVAMRTERWDVEGHGNPHLLTERWPTIVDEAGERGLASVWLLWEPSHRLVSLVYYASPATPMLQGPLGPLPPAPGLLPQTLLAQGPPLGDVFDDQDWRKESDLTHHVLTTWFPFQAGDQGRAAPWPNSPPFPTPHPADGVCSPSRGETHGSSLDCLPTCGNGHPDKGETTANCPSDVRPHWTAGEDV